MNSRVSSTMSSYKQQDVSIIPSFAVFAFAKEDNTPLLVVIRSTSSSAFLLGVSNMHNQTPLHGPYFSSRYNSPRLTKAVSYSRTAASDVTAGGLEMISLYSASAFRGSVFASVWASCILGDSGGAMFVCL